MLQLPSPPETNNVRALAQMYRETFTNLTTSTITLSYMPLGTINGVALESVLLNGQRLSNGPDYTINAKVITLLTPFGPLVASDVVEVCYPYSTAT